jgi:hypothetical protein
LVAPQWKVERLKVLGGEKAVWSKEPRVKLTVPQQDVEGMVDAADGKPAGAYDIFWKGKTKIGLSVL